MSSFLLLGSSSKKLPLHTESRSRCITPGNSTGLSVGRGGGGRCLCFGEVALIRASDLHPFSAAELHTSASDCLFLVLLELFLHICLPSNTAINNKATSRMGEPGRVSRHGGGGELRCGKHVSIEALDTYRSETR